MSNTQSDYARTDELDDMLVALSGLPEILGLSPRTVERITQPLKKHPYTTDVPGRGPGKAVRWGDLQHALEKRRNRK